MPVYTQPFKVVTGKKLAAELRAAGLPLIAAFPNGFDPAVSVSSVIEIVTSVALTAPQEATLASVVTAHTPDPNMRPRLFYEIRADIAALTGAQKTNTWNAFTAGNPQLWMLDSGLNASSLAVLHLLATSGLGAADILEAKIRAVTMYVEDNRNWLVNPAFDPTINVPGYVAV